VYRRFSQLIGVDHPKIWKFIIILKEEQSFNEFLINPCIIGNDPPHSRKTYKDFAKCIETIVNDYYNRYLLNYLREIEHYFDLNV